MWKKFKTAKPTEGMIIIRNTEKNSYEMISFDDMKDAKKTYADQFEWTVFQTNPNKSGFQQGIEKGYKDGWEDSTINYGLEYDPQAVARGFREYLDL